MIYFLKKIILLFLFILSQSALGVECAKLYSISEEGPQSVKHHNLEISRAETDTHSEQTSLPGPHFYENRSNEDSTVYISEDSEAPSGFESYEDMSGLF